jgi:hypothetical protein
MKRLILLYTFTQCLNLAVASDFEACLLNIKIHTRSDKLKGSGPSLSLNTEFTPTETLQKEKSESCNSLLGQKITKNLAFKSKQFIPFIKPGNVVTVDYSHFIIDKKEPSLNMEVWKVVNIKTKRADHD